MIMKERYLWESWQIKRWLLLFIFCISNSVFQAVAQTESPRIYTEEDPLIYEDARDLWPYSYINDEGEPEGFNIDLIDKLMKALNIPYVVKLKSQQEAFDDLKAGRSDLTLGLATGFHDAYGHYGRHAVTLFTQSVASPKKNKVEIKTFRDLSKDGLQVIVNDSSLCHHLMLDYGWADHVIATRDPKKTIQDISTNEEGQMVWNTLSLRWLIKRFHLDNLEVTPVNMPHGEYKFMSNDQHLLNLLDDTYANLNLNNEISPIENKWFYPEHVEPQTPVWVWYFVAIAALLFIIALVFMAIYQIQARRIIKENRKLNRRLALIIETSGVRIWTYDVKQHEFAWRSDNGKIAYTYSVGEFAQRYIESDCTKLKDALNRLVTQHKDDRGHEEEEITLELKAKDMEDGDNELRDFIVVLSVLERDKDGKPTMIIGTKKDVTGAHRLKRIEDERTLRYWSIFYSEDAAIFQFDKHGTIVDASPKACELCHCNSDELVKQHIHINDFFKTSFTDLTKTDDFHAIQIINGEKIEYKMKVCNNDNNKLIGIFVFCQAYQTDFNF